MEEELRDNIVSVQLLSHQCDTVTSNRQAIKISLVGIRCCENYNETNDGYLSIDEEVNQRYSLNPLSIFFFSLKVVRRIITVICKADYSEITGLS